MRWEPLTGNMKLKNTIFLFCLLLVFACGISAQQTENGFELYEKGEYQKASEVLQKAVASDENDRKLWLYLGMIYARLNDGKQAVEALKKADKLAIKEPGENETAAKIIFNPRVNYTREARDNSISGTVSLAVEFGADGEIKYVFPFQKLPFGLTEKSIETARKIRFNPMTRDGKPVASIKIVKYSFAIY